MLVLGYELAGAVFGTPVNAIQKTARLNGMAFTIIGVMRTTDLPIAD